MSSFSNDLTEAQIERLAILSEELGEVQQCIGKILRHGYFSSHPTVDTGGNNRYDLEIELGDVWAAISMLNEAQDIDGANMLNQSNKKRSERWRWTHHQGGL
jgi:NTP pyrophosphatase (non-canonical NTP hydrolase)